MSNPRFSKNAINRTGERLVTDPTDEEALEVLDYWRGLHAVPLEVDGQSWQRFATTLSDANIGIYHLSSRLKRSVSIIEKLKRYSSMKLSRMHDIAGLRIVFQNATPGRFSGSWTIDKNTEFYSFFESAKHIVDYVINPKSDGYRAIHVINEITNGPLPIHNGLLIETQYRTYLQHLWAMAVETIDIFYGQALKAGQGDRDWQDFFKLASAALSHIEKSPVMAEHAGKSFEQIRTELLHEGSEKTFFSKLAAIKEVDETYSAEDYDYWLLELNIKKSENRIFGFKAEQIETAQEMYSVKEQTPACRRGDVQVVLVSTQSFKDLRQAYPSYFLDVAEFTKTIKQICYEGTVSE